MNRRRALRQLGLAGAGIAVGRGLAGVAASGAEASSPVSPRQALAPSDVVFMYEASAATYAAYGATVLAWGGTPTAEKLKAAAGVAWHGSVGMVTEFGRYYDRFPATWAEGLCRDVHGRPLKVPWLTDHQHHGEPFWWCCTRQPQFRRYLEERVSETIGAGAQGLHVDDHLGSAGALFLGACFCARCVAGFRDHLAALDPARRAPLGVSDLSGFDYAAVLRRWLEEGGDGSRGVQDHPLWREWSIYQLRGAATSMNDLRALAQRVAGGPIPVSANAGLLWPNHLADYRALDYLSAEMDHDARSRRLNDQPLLAYRMADAVGRPFAATASGQDWAFVKEHALSGLVRCWIAASYAAGHRLMAPHRQWCYTPQKGTHWYDGPAEAYAPLFRFVRANAALLDDHEPFAELAVVMPHRSWAADRERWLTIAERLAAANVGYRLALGSDEVVDHPLAAPDLAGVRVVLDPARDDLLPGDRALVETASRSTRVVSTVEAALEGLRPAATVARGEPVRVLPRIAPRRVVVHVLNRAYEPERDAVRELLGVRLALDRQALGIAAAVGHARVLSPDAAAAEVALGADGGMTLSLRGAWTLVEIERGA